MKKRWIREWPYYLGVFLLVFLIPQLFLAQPGFDDLLPGGIMGDGPWTDLASQYLGLFGTFVPLAVFVIFMIHSIRVGSFSWPLVGLTVLSLGSYLFRLTPKAMTCQLFTLAGLLISQLLLLIPLEKSERRCLGLLQFFTLDYALLLQAYGCIHATAGQGGGVSWILSSLCFLPTPLICALLPLSKSVSFSKNGACGALGIFLICALFFSAFYLGGSWELHLAAVAASGLSFYAVEHLLQNGAV